MQESRQGARRRAAADAGRAAEAKAAADTRRAAETKATADAWRGAEAVTSLAVDQVRRLTAAALHRM